MIRNNLYSLCRNFFEIFYFMRKYSRKFRLGQWQGRRYRGE